MFLKWLKMAKSHVFGLSFVLKHELGMALSVFIINENGNYVFLKDTKLE
jgi:hypothetical protein